MNIPADVYEYLTNFADDRTILNMLSVNKKFSDDNFFKRVLERRYPHLLKFKPGTETHKNLYLRMIHAIAKLQEDYDIPYFSIPDYNPYYFNWRTENDLWLTKITIYTQAAGYAAKAGDLEQLKKMLNKGGKGEYILGDAAIGGYLGVVKYLMDNYDYDIGKLNYSLGLAASKGFMDIVKYLVSKGATGFGNLLINASYGNQHDIIKYAIDQWVTEEDIDVALNETDNEDTKQLIIDYYNSRK